MVYCRSESPDLTLVGNGNIEEEADPDSYNQKAGMGFVQDIWPRISKRMPILEEAEYFTGYAGLYTETPDQHPVIDKVEGIDGLYICTGFSGHGFKEAPIVGIAVAELILDGQATSIDISPLRMGRFREGALNEIGYAFRVIA
ncbi:MAG: NAD(P)/FAD-dependent oxidoreductase [Dehalococcoidia bacterium]